MRGILLINVGTPASDSKNDVKRFIWDMLSDPLVTGKPEWRSRLLARKIIATLSAKGIPVEVAKRYGKPDFATAVKEMEKRYPLLHEVIVFPLYPQYAQSTTQTAIEDIARSFYSRLHSFRL